MTDMPHARGLGLGEAVAETVYQTACMTPGIKAEALQRGTSFSIMILRIQRQLGVPLILAFDEVQVSSR